MLEAVPHRLEGGPDRPRRRWSVEAKMALIEETLKPGANVSAIARQAGISPAQLFGWRRKAMQAGVVQGEPHEQRLGFVEVTPTSSMIEMVVADVVVRVPADVNQNHLVNILRAVRQA
ncbi:transposase [Microvirga sp. BT689]|uniref:transposase n=1 Tax=Microvirga arvi TaxID=2778731 RepID=UPI00194F863F|nr:transposase [Microvirga arvi]MBM6583765.1 transposase [Microvirga arvi]